MLIAICLILFWKFARNAVKINVYSPSIEKITAYNRLKRITGYYWAIFICFVFMVLIYSMAPDYYFIFLPIENFNHSIVNEMGLLTLQISLVWILIAQLQIDKELYKYSRDIDSLSAMELVSYSEKMLLSGMLVLFIGVLITITNILSLILVMCGFYIYFKK